MERKSNQFTYAAAQALAAAALVATIAFAPSPVIGAETSAAKATADKSSAAKTAARVDAVEARIKDMHAKLKITPAQEDQWAKVAQVMRDNEKTMEPLFKAREQNAKSRTAIDDLKSYGEITDAHADGIKKFTPIFATLYASMSDTQKKDADAMFRRGGHRKTKSA
jgi:periplasmic protein CpxP/Spy